MYLVRPPGETSPSETYGLADLVHEEAHRVILILDKPFLNAFRLCASTLRWSSRFNLLTTLLEKSA